MIIIYLKNEIMKVFFNESIFSFCAYTSTNSFFLSFCNIFFTSELTTVWCLLQKVLGSPLHLSWMILKFITSAFSKCLSGLEINLSFFNWSMYVSSSSFSNHFRSFRTTSGIYLLKYFQTFYWCTRRTKCTKITFSSIVKRMQFSWGGWCKVLKNYLSKMMAFFYFKDSTASAEPLVRQITFLLNLTKSNLIFK